MKANDNIPADEMLLAEAIAAAKARGLKHTTGAAFRNSVGQRLIGSKGATACCALGGLALAGVISEAQAANTATHSTELRDVHHGNDMGVWDFTQRDAGESLGWAFRCAMTQEEP